MNLQRYFRFPTCIPTSKTPSTITDIPDCSSDVDFLVIRTTENHRYEESFKLYERNDTSGILVFTQAAVDYEILNWVVLLHPGVYILMITDSVSDGYSFGSRVDFVYGVFFAATSLFIEYPSLYIYLNHS